MKTIKVVYTTRVLSSEELKTKSLKNYYFLCSYKAVKVGDLIVSPMYTTPMMVVEIINSDSTIRNGFNLKNIIIDTINGFSVEDITDQRSIKAPLYKVGDKVLIKKHFDPGYYPELCKEALGRMEKTYGGTIQEIVKVIPNDEITEQEPFIYRLKDVSYLVWYSSMFASKVPNVKYTKSIINKEITTEESTNQDTKGDKMEKKSIFAGFIEKYKAQFIPEKDESLKLSMDGKVCALIGNEYVGIDENNELISYPAEMCLDFPIYLIAKPYSQVEVGDIIKINRSYVKVLKKNPNRSLSCLTFSGYTQNKKEVKDFILGQAFVKTVVNMFGNMKVGGFNPMMLALANGEMNAKDLLLMQMFQGGATTQANQMNPMLMMALIDKGEDSSMLETLFAPTSENK